MFSPLLRATFLVFVASILPLTASDWWLVAVPQQDGQVLDLSRPFRVILNNNSTHNLIVWSDEGAWGGSALSFEFTGKDGKIIKVVKNQNSSSARNSSAGFVVLPGCAYPMTVNLWERTKTGKSEWLGTEALHGSMMMKTIYQNTHAGTPKTQPDPFGKAPDAKLKPVTSAWIGRVDSAPIKVSIER